MTSSIHRKQLLVRALRLPFVGRVLDMLRERSAVNIARQNTRESTDRIYKSDWLLGAVLNRERLEFYEEIASKCASRRPHSVIDVGCGTGHLLRFIVDETTLAPDRIVGVDHAGAGINRARELLPEATWLVEDLFDLPLDGERFDLVLCTEVLEHLDNPAGAVEVLRGLCAPGGRVVVTVPDGARDSWDGHVNFWDEEELQAFLTPHGLDRIDRIERGNTLLAWLTSAD
jgi:2-polyprenyl-3-methyl-5-hydroxy-6-metoxy-1,4-benzoquinol methylase